MLCDCKLQNPTCVKLSLLSTAEIKPISVGDLVQVREKKSSESAGELSGVATVIH